MRESTLSRRHFLRGAAAAGLLFVPGLGCGEGQDEAGRGPDTGRGPDHSRVVVARSDEVRAGEGELKAGSVKALLDESVRRLTGKPDVRSAWRSLFSADERVTIKVCCLPGAVLSTRPEVVLAVVDGQLTAGVRPANIIVWERSDREMVQAGFEIRDSRNAVRYFGTDHLPAHRRYTSQIQTAGDVGSLMSRILADHSDAVISVPVLKDHDLAGVSLAMKNFFGAIHNPNKYHDNHCDPYIAQLMTHRFLRDRLRLMVTDGTLAQAHRGPAYAPAYAWHWNGLIVSRDPVAADAVGAQIIGAHRQELKLPSLQEAGRPPVYIQTAQRLGVGVADADRIERIEV